MADANSISDLICKLLDESLSKLENTSVFDRIKILEKLQAYAGAEYSSHDQLYEHCGENSTVTEDRIEFKVFLHEAQAIFEAEIEIGSLSQNELKKNCSDPSF